MNHPPLKKCHPSVSHIAFRPGFLVSHPGLPHVYIHFFPKHLEIYIKRQQIWINKYLKSTLPETNMAPENRPGPNRKGSSSNHNFSGENSLLNLRGVNILSLTWVVPPPSKSHHQDNYIFSRESQTKPSFPLLLGGGTTQSLTSLSNDPTG